jgi:hypothetical protein
VQEKSKNLTQICFFSFGALRFNGEASVRNASGSSAFVGEEQRSIQTVRS